MLVEHERWGWGCGSRCSVLFYLFCLSFLFGGAMRQNGSSNHPGAVPPDAFSILWQQVRLSKEACLEFGALVLDPF